MNNGEKPSSSPEPIEPEGFSLFRRKRRGADGGVKEPKKGGGGFLPTCCLTSCTLFLGLSLAIVILSYHLLKDLFSDEPSISGDVPVHAAATKEAMTRLLKSIETLESGEAETFFLELSEIEFNGLVGAQEDIVQWFYLKEGGVRYVASLGIGRRLYFNIEADADIEIREFRLRTKINNILLGRLSLPDFILDLLTDEMTGRWEFAWGGVALEEIVKDAVFHDRKVSITLSKGGPFQ